MIFISMSSVFIIAQNLVPNGNFEHHRPFDGSGLTIGSMAFPYDWKTINQPSTYCHRYFVKNFGQERLKQGGYINFDTLVLFEGDAMIELEYGENCPYPYAVNSGEREPLIPVNVNPLKRAHEVNFKRTI